MLILLSCSCTHLLPLPLVQQAGWDIPVSVGMAVAQDSLWLSGLWPRRAVCSERHCLCRDVYNTLYIFVYKSKKEKKELLFLQSFLCGAGWELGPGRRGPQLRQGCRSMRGAKGGAGGCAVPLCEHKPCPAAGNLAVSHGSQPKWALPLACRGIKGFAAKSELDGELHALRLGWGKMLWGWCGRTGEGSFTGSLCSRC